MTMDIDLILAMDEGNLDRFIDCAASAGLSPIAPVPLAALKDPVQRQQWIEQKHMIAFALHNSLARIPVMVDILISPPVDIEAAFTRAITRDVDGTPLHVAAIEDMIRLKENTGRQQDRSDIEHLERLHGR